MSRSSAIGSFVVLLGYAIILFLLVRPGSQGPSVLNAFWAGIQGTIARATGGGTWSQA